MRWGGFGSYFRSTVYVFHNFLYFFWPYRNPKQIELKWKKKNWRNVEDWVMNSCCDWVLKRFPDTHNKKRFSICFCISNGKPSSFRIIHQTTISRWLCLCRLFLLYFFLSYFFFILLLLLLLLLMKILL